MKNTLPETIICLYTGSLSYWFHCFFINSLFIQCIQVIIILFMNLCFSCILCIEFFDSFYIHNIFGLSLLYLCIYFVFIVLCYDWCVIRCRHWTVDVHSYDYWKPFAHKWSEIWMERCVRVLVWIQVNVSRKTVRVGYGSIHTYEYRF